MLHTKSFSGRWMAPEITIWSSFTHGQNSFERHSHTYPALYKARKKTPFRRPAIRLWQSALCALANVESSAGRLVWVSTICGLGCGAEALLLHSPSLRQSLSVSVRLLVGEWWSLGSLPEEHQP